MAAKPKLKLPCEGNGDRVPDMWNKDSATCTTCGKNVRVVNYRPKLGGRFGDHIDERK